MAGAQNTENPTLRLAGETQAMTSGKEAAIIRCFYQNEFSFVFKVVMAIRDKQMNIFTI